MAGLVGSIAGAVVGLISALFLMLRTFRNEDTKRQEALTALETRLTDRLDSLRSEIREDKHQETLMALLQGIKGKTP